MNTRESAPSVFSRSHSPRHKESAAQKGRRFLLLPIGSGRENYCGAMRRLKLPVEFSIGHPFHHTIDKNILSIFMAYYTVYEDQREAVIHIGGFCPHQREAEPHAHSRFTLPDWHFFGPGIKCMDGHNPPAFKMLVEPPLEFRLIFHHSRQHFQKIWVKLGSARIFFCNNQNCLFHSRITNGGNYTLVNQSSTTNIRNPTTIHRSSGGIQRTICASLALPF